MNGACGRMGQMVIKTVLADEEMELVGAVDIKAHQDVGEVQHLPRFKYRAILRFPCGNRALVVYY